MPPLIETHNLVKIYKMSKKVEVTALREISLTVNEGEFLAITGPSGSGKTTLLDILGCLDEPTSGTLRFQGKVIQEISRTEQTKLRNQAFGFVFQNFNLLDRTNIVDNVELPLFYAGLKLEERRKKSKELIEKLGLTEFASHHPNQLSGGQQQRVAIARALINRPSVIFADEPTGNLDTLTGLEVISIFQKLNKEKGLTIILVTHEPEIVRFANRIVTLRDGKIMEDSSKESVNAAEELEKLL